MRRNTSEIVRTEPEAPAPAAWARLLLLAASTFTLISIALLATAR